MGIKKFIGNHPILTAVAGLSVLYFSGKAIDNYFLDPIIEGEIIAKTKIPKDLHEKSRKEFPFWVDVKHYEKGKGVVSRLTFDTDNYYWDSEKNKKVNYLFYIRVGSGPPFENKALELDEQIKIGETFRFRVDERSGYKRTVEEILGKSY